MDNILTYKMITDVIRTICDAHLNIENVYFTRQENIQDGDINFPAIFCNPEGVSMPVTESNTFKAKEMSLSIKIFDLIDKENDNEIDVFSDGEQILSDLVTILSQHEDIQKKNAFISEDVELEPLYEELDSSVNGWEAIFTIRMLNKNSYCGLPVGEINI